MRTKTIIIIVVCLLIGGLIYAYVSFAWMFFVKPKDGGINYEQKIHFVAGSESQESGFKDGIGNEARLFKPIRLANLNDSTIILADINNHAIRLLSNSRELTTLCGGADKQGYEDGFIEDARFDNPHGVAVRKDGVIAIAEVKNNTIRLLKPIMREGKESYLVSTLAGVSGKCGMQDGENHIALFDSPHAVAWGADGELYVADIGNSRIRMIFEGKTSTVAGRDESGKLDGDAKTGTLKYPMDIVTDSIGNIWMVDAGSMQIRKWNRADGLTTPFPEAEIAMPHGITLLDNKYVIVAEMYGHRILAYDIETKQVSTLAGTTEKGVGESNMTKPAAVLVAKNKIWIADLGNHRVVNIDIPIID